MTSTTSDKVIDNVEDNFSHHGLPLTLNSASKMELCFSRTKANGEVEMQNASLCAPSGKEIALVMILMQRHHCVVFSYGNYYHIKVPIT